MHEQQDQQTDGDAAMRPLASADGMHGRSGKQQQLAAKIQFDNGKTESFSHVDMQPSSCMNWPIKTQT